MGMVACWNRVSARQALTGIVAVLVMLSFSLPCRADGNDHRALRLLLDKGIITQQEYDQAVKEEEPQGQQEKQAQKQAEQEQVKEAATKGLQVKIGGFAELDFMGDNTRSFDEIAGNRPVLRSNTLAGANGRFETSPRNSRITIDVRAPERDGIKSQYFAAMDFLGNEPDIATASVSELTARTSPTARIFQMYFKVETPVVDVKVGQDWSRFGFMSEYSRGQLSVAATPANMFNRWVQASISKRLWLTDTLSLTPVLSVERPPQRDANLPSFVAGIQLAHHGLQAPYSGSSSGGVSLKPLSIQLSGVGRRLEANSGGQTNLNSQSYVTGWGMSSSLFLPVIPSRNGELGNTAHVVLEGVSGAGIADFFNGLSWGVCSPVCGNSPSSSGFGGAAFGQTNIDAGLGAVSSQTGKFEAIRTTSMMVHATYYLPDEGKTWIGGGYGTIYSSNANEMTCSVGASFCGGATRTASSIYTRDSTYYANVFHDFTDQIRAALETNFIRTTYADGAQAENRRIQITFFYRF